MFAAVLSLQHVQTFAHVQMSVKVISYMRDLKGTEFIFMFHMCYQTVVHRYRDCFTFTSQIHKEDNGKQCRFCSSGSLCGDYEELPTSGV
jgi:hypothetical protein